jgi:hypothetical protein
VTEKLTGKTALEATEAIWRKLSENGNNHKPDTEFVSNCPCCEYVMQQVGRMPECADKGVYIPWKTFNAHLALCPLKTLWPEGCRGPASPYELWFESAKRDAKARRQYAKQIADAAKAELERLAVL